MKCSEATYSFVTLCICLKPFPLESLEGNLEVKEMKVDAPIPPPPDRPWGLLT